MKILLAEDYPVNRTVVLVHLQKAGYQVDIAENGIQAVEMFKKNNYDIVLMDIQMPEMDGNEATSLIRKFEENASGYNSTRSEAQNSSRKTRTPIIAMTAHEEKKIIDKCFESGMDDFIKKPIKQENIIRIVEKWVTEKGIPERAGDNKEQISENVSMSSSETFNYKEALNVFDNDKKLIHKLLNLFLQDGKKKITAMSDAIDSNNNEIISKETHALKGAALNVCVDGVFNTATQLEKIADTNDIDAKKTALDAIRREMNIVENFLKSFTIENDLG